MDSKEAFLAAKVLVDFIRDLTSLAEQQLLAIRRLMEVTVQDVMSSVSNISSTADAKKNQASEVLVRDDHNNDFKKTSTQDLDREGEVASAESLEKRRAFLESKLRRAGGVFSKHMEALSTTDTEVQNLLIRVVGSVSMDDVMAQRLSHVIQAIYQLRSGLAKVVSHHRDYQTQKNVKQLRNEILTEVYCSYTAEEEKEIFHKIFGQPKANKKVS